MGMDVYGASGNYFRANCWSWRPIVEAIYESSGYDIIDSELMAGMGFNDGKGLQDAESCNELANTLEDWVETNVTTKYQPDGLAGICDVIKGTGRMATQADIEEGVEVESAYWTDKDHLLEFVSFLRECGEGFEVW